MNEEMEYLCEEVESVRAGWEEQKQRVVVEE
jgi:hypothetical protein